MALKLAVKPNITFLGDVKIPVPGESEPAILTVRFKHKNKHELRKWTLSATTDFENIEERDADYLMEVIDGWVVGPEDENGRMIPFSREALISVLSEYHGAGAAFFDGYMTALHRGRLGN